LIEAHLSLVFAALAVGRLIQDRTGWTIKKFVRAARRYRTVHIGAGQQILTAADPFPPDLRDALHRSAGKTLRTSLIRVGSTRPVTST
jgi:hypothetical protein